MLFVSGLDLDALGSCRQSGADLVCVDLEDAVPMDLKDRARASLAAVSQAEGAGPAPVVVRINAIRSWMGIEDLRACLALGDRIAGVILPKVDGADEIRLAATLAEEASSSIELLAIIETAKGLAEVAGIATAHPRLRGLVFGGFDLSTALGCAMAWEPLLHARSVVVHAAALAGIDVIDAPHAAIDDEEGLRDATKRSKALGMTGKAAKDVRQIGIIQDVLRPSPQEIAHAQRIVALFEAAPGTPLVVDGRLVELPTIRRLRRIGVSQ
ncbi:HpcH/HpaI aldolase/citrate lyase family protein [Bosea thiooxidans]